jgi:hypothetical protein
VLFCQIDFGGPNSHESGTASTADCEKHMCQSLVDPNDLHIESKIANDTIENSSYQFSTLLSEYQSIEDHNCEKLDPQTSTPNRDSLPGKHVQMKSSTDAHTRKSNFHQVYELLAE